MLKKISSLLLPSLIKNLMMADGGGYQGKSGYEDDSSEKDRFYELLLSNLHGMAYRCLNDKNWTMEYVSQGCYDLTGYTTNDLIGNSKISFNELILEEYRNVLWETWQKLLVEKKFFEGEYQIRTADGTVKWVWEKGCGVFDGSGNLLALEGFITDISEKKAISLEKEKAKTELASLQKHLQGIVEYIDQSIILFDIQQRILFANPKATKLFSEVFNISIDTGKSLDLVEMNKALPGFGETSQMVFCNPDNLIFRNRYSIDSFEDLWLKWVFNPVFDDKVIYAVCLSITDITQNQALNEDVYQKKTLLRSVLDTIPIAVYAKDNEGRKILTNKHDLMHSGVEAEEDVLGKKDSEIYSSDVSVVFMDDDEKVLKEGSSIIHREESIIGSDGKKRIVLTSKVPMKDEKGNTIGLIGIGHDITELKNAHSALRQSEESFLSVANAAPFPVSVFTLDGVLLYANSHSLNLYQCTIDEVIDQNVAHRFWVKPEMRTEWVRKLKKSGVVTDFEMQMQNLDGTQKYWVMTSGAIIYFKNQEAIFASHHDITLKTETLDRIRESENRLKELNYSKDRFFSIIAHDLKSPFNAILGFSELLYQDYDDFNEQDRKRYIKNIFEASDNTYRLIQNLLDWSRLQLGRLEIRHDNVDISVSVNDTILLLKPIADAKNIRIVSEVKFNTMVLSDEDIIKTILRNLITNAIKFSHPGSSVHVSAKYISDEAQLIVSVKDAGIGLTLEEMDDLFRIDRKVQHLGTQDEKGTGLGLLLCKDFVQRLGGSIGVESVYGSGSNFYFKLPIK